MAIFNTKNKEIRFGHGIHNIIKPNIEFNFNGIPNELKAYNNWVIWAIIEKEAGVKPDKAPVFVSDDGSYIGLAKWGSADKDRRLSWHDALKCYERWRHLGLIAGIGYIFDKDDPFVFIDIDKVNSGVGHGSIGLDIVTSSGVRTWMETSVSGNGYHIIVRGGLDGRRGINSGGIEIYDSGRFCAMTGHCCSVDGGSVDGGSGGSVADGSEMAPVADGTLLIKKLLDYISGGAGSGGGAASGGGANVERETGRYGDGVWDGRVYKLPNEVYEGNRDNTMYEYIQSLWYKYGSGRDDGVVDDSDDGRSNAIEQALLVNIEQFVPPLSDDRIFAMIEDRWRLELNKLREVEEELFNNYIFVKSLNKWYDCRAGIVMNKQALDTIWAYKYPGTRSAPKLTTVLERSGRMIDVDSLTWYPARWSGAGVRVGEDDKIITIQGERMVNTWKGYKIEPVDVIDGAGGMDGAGAGADEMDGAGAGADEMDVYWRLLRHLFIEDKWCNIVLDWMAFAVQYPEVKCNWQLMVVGVPGAGKNALFSPFMNIWGRAGKCVNPKELETDYDDGFCETKVVLFSEIGSLGDKHMENLKCKAASESGGVGRVDGGSGRVDGGSGGVDGLEFVDINPKGRSKVLMPNLWSLILLSNNMDALRLTEKERRFLVLYAGTEMDEELRETYFTWLGRGGSSVLFRYLLDRDISVNNGRGGFDRAVCEKTPWFWSCFDASRTDAETLFEDMIDRGELGDLVNPEYVCETLLRKGIKVRVAKVTLWLENAGYQSYPKGKAGEEDFKIQKKVDGIVKYKSRKWMAKKTSKFSYENLDVYKIKVVDIYDEVDRLEKIYLSNTKY